MFAKLFDSEFGQILVKKDEGDDGPEVRFFFQPEGFGVCNLAVGFSDNDAGWEKADAFFEAVDQASARDVVSRSLLFGEAG